MSESSRPNQEFMPTFRYASERDVDVLLVEELFCAREFVAFFLVSAAKLANAGGIREWDVKHSVGRQYSRRELDIRLNVALEDGEKVCLLIENKLDTSEQPEQAESYRAECLELVGRKEFDRVYCALVAPAAYIRKYEEFSAKFDTAISYEDVRDELTSRISRDAGLDEELVMRLKHKSSLLTQAIEKQRRGYVQIALPEKAGFNAAYIALAKVAAPNCRPGPQMLRPDGNPAESVSMLFDAAATFRDLPQNIRPRRFSHEFGRGMAHRANYVAVVFSKWGKNLKALKEAFEDDLKGTPYRLQANVTSARPNPGLVLYEPTEAVDYDRGFEPQESKIRWGLERAEALRRWVFANQEILQKWSDLIAARVSGER